MINWYSGRFEETGYPQKNEISYLSQLEILKYRRNVFQQIIQ